MNVSERRATTSTRWTAISSTTALCWDWPSDPAGQHRITGVIAYGDQLATDLRGVPLRRFASMPRDAVEALPHWKNPPTSMALKAAWFASELSAADPEQLQQALGNQGQAVSTWVASTAGLTEALTRRPGEDPDEFYARVADAYRLIGASTGAPTAGLAEAAGVPKSTAARWVRAARARGHLPKTTRGRI